MSKEVKEGSWESRGAQKHKNSVVCEISQPKIAPCEIATLLRNYFATPRSRYENATLLRNDFVAQLPPLGNTPLAHECHFAAQYPHFAAAKSPKREISNFRSQSPISQGVSQLRNHPLAHECHFTAPYTHFAAAKWLRNPPCLKILQRAHHEFAPPFQKLLDTFRSLLEVHFMHTISRFEAREVRSPTLQTILNLELNKEVMAV